MIELLVFNWKQGCGVFCIRCLFRLLDYIHMFMMCPFVVGNSTVLIFLEILPLSMSLRSQSSRSSYSLSGTFCRKPERNVLSTHTCTSFPSIGPSKMFTISYWFASFLTPEVGSCNFNITLCRNLLFSVIGCPGFNTSRTKGPILKTRNQ